MTQQYKDPADFIQSGGDFNILINSAHTTESFYFMVTSREKGIEEKQMKKDILKILKKGIKKRKDVPVFIKEISLILGLDEPVIYDHFKIPYDNLI